MKVHFHIFVFLFDYLNFFFLLSYQNAVVSPNPEGFRYYLSLLNQAHLRNLFENNYGQMVSAYP